MKKDIPQIEFKSALKEHFDFEIISIEKIKENKLQYQHNPELPHQLKFYNLIFFTKGNGKHFVDFNWYPVQKNSLVYLTKEQVNAFDFSKNLEGFCVIFTEKYFVGCFSTLPENFIFRLFIPQLFSPIVQIPEASDFEDYFGLLRKEYGKSNAFNYKTIIESLFVVLISKAEHIKQNQTFHIKNTKKISLFQKFTTLIEKKLSESRSADFYARELGITYKHLNTTCKELLHKTAKNVIDDFVILQAKRSLINSSIKSAQLAYRLGFEDPSNFTKYFKKNTGITPKQFLKSAKNK
ncbi:MAG: helix-turn-helix domain-containing protein [Bacteroidota bacterium]